MARVPYVSRDDVPDAHKAAYDRIVSERGGAHVFLALANIPNLTADMLNFTGQMRSGSVIEPRLRELSIMTVGHVNDCSYEFDHHWNHALKAGLRRAQMEQLDQVDTSPEYDARERAIVRYAKEVTLTSDASERTWSDLREHFSIRETMDIVMSVAWYNAVVRILKPLRVEMEPNFARE